MAVLDNIPARLDTTATTLMPLEDTTPFKILPTMGMMTSPNDITGDVLSALPTVHASELLIGDDPKLDLAIMNQTESPLRMELDILPLDTWDEILSFILKGLVMGAVILTSVLGNLLVIVSVARYHKLRVITNYFVVSMALADMLVALMAMVFNASVQLTGTWIFGSLMCDLWNSMDVYFCTVSILHLCCISIDRYTAIVQPLDYPLRMTKRTVAFMLAVAWISPLFISVVPIFLGWYTTQEQLELMALNPGLCNFKVNLIYAMVSSSMSFWIPGIIMLVMYFRIYKEADRQEMMVYRNCVGQKGFDPRSRSNRVHQPYSAIPAIKRKLRNTRSTVAALLLNKHLHINGLSKGSVKITDNTQISKNGVSNSDDTQNAASEPLQSPNVRPIGPGGEVPSDDSTPSPTPGGTPRTKRAKSGNKRRLLNVGVRKSSGEARAVSPGIEVDSEDVATKEEEPKEIEKDKLEVPLANPQTKKKSSPLNKMKRERKAAKTLGIIVSCFLLCWLPFFTWYLIDTLCGENCQSPELLVTILFWIGYFNSTLNPVIYAYFNRDFRKAFRKTLNHYYKVFGCRFCTKLCQKCCRCGTCCASLRKTCCCCFTCPLCYALCPRLSKGDDTPSSEIPQRSGVSSDYVHIEMTTVEQHNRQGL